MISKSHSGPIIELFQSAARGYDAAPLRFSPFAADRLLSFVRPRAGQKLLDVASGTGALTVAAAQAAGPAGRVTAVDLSEAMLARLEDKLRRSNLNNVDIHVMDAEALVFRRGAFDHTLCALAIHLMSDPRRALAQWARVTRRGGTVAFSAYSPRAFTPLLGRLADCIRAQGIAPPPSPWAAGMRMFPDPAACMRLMTEAGLNETRAAAEQVGYHLAGPEEWWEVVQNSGLRWLIAALDPGEREAVRSNHLRELADMTDAKGLWLDVEVFFALATVGG